MRGLKPTGYATTSLPGNVAPSRVRGLKPFEEFIDECDKDVAPSRVRGLKRPPPISTRTPIGRTFTGAWIETPSDTNLYNYFYVAPSRVRGLKL